MVNTPSEHITQALRARLRLIYPNRFRAHQDLTPFEYRFLPGPTLEDFERLAGREEGWQSLSPGDRWGRWGTDFAMRSNIIIPFNWSLANPIALYLPLGDANDGFQAHPEALIYFDDVPFTATDKRHPLIMLPANLKDHNPHTLALHGWTGVGPEHAPTTHDVLTMGACALVQIDQPTLDFITLADFALETVDTLPQTDPIRVGLVRALTSAFDHLDTRHPIRGERFYTSVPGALAALRNGITEAGPPLPLNIHAVGHAHIDTAWLWPLAQTRRKVARTFHTVLHLMDQYPNYRFAASQPQLYDFARQEHPHLFERIKTRVADGRWEPLGGMWVEPDANLPGAESLIRQFTLGKAFFREHFGANADSNVLWLPDTFGFPASLPQVARLAGFRYFFTIKLTWNETNTFPHDTFWWHGLDGSRLLAHISPTPQTVSHPAATYNAELRPGVMRATWDRHKSAPADVLTSYGWGDGGGGPTSEMLEHLGLLADFPGLPRAKPARVLDFYESVEAAHGDDLAAWSGELYLETHQGTFTSQAALKQHVHNVERLLHDVEFLAAYTVVLYADYAYPLEKMTNFWRVLALNHFHDILPGSSIAEVYTEANAQLSELTNALIAERTTILDAIGEVVGGDLIIVNTVDFQRQEPVEISREGGRDFHITDDHTPTSPLVHQVTADSVIASSWIMPPLSITPVTVQETPPKPPASDETIVDAGQLSMFGAIITAEPQKIITSQLELELDSNGQITRLYDRYLKRDVLSETGNVFQMFEDRPLNFDAWNIDREGLAHPYTDDTPADSIELVESGPLRATIEVKRKLMNSTLRQRISVYADSTRIDFHTVIDWRERNTLLKVAFPVEMHAPRAVYDIQWGYVERPTHRNTSWDSAQYEVPHHRRMQLEEFGYHIALLSDGKYGGDVTGNVLRLTLLKSATWPDPDADQGTHTFRYALYPHQSFPEWGRREGYVFNHPLVTHWNRAKVPPKHSPEPLVSVAGPGARSVTIETVKPADDGRGLIIRLYESLRGRGTFGLVFSFKPSAVYLTDIYEQDETELDLDEMFPKRVNIHLKPFQIMTLRVMPPIAAALTREVPVIVAEPEDAS